VARLPFPLIRGTDKERAEVRLLLLAIVLGCHFKKTVKEKVW
jgi:hypothetical protein